MKFSKFGRAILACGCLLWCGNWLSQPAGISNTVDYVYVTNSKKQPGSDQRLLRRRTIGRAHRNSRFAVSLRRQKSCSRVTSPNGKTLYVINHDDNTVVQFAIGTDAKLYPPHTYNTPGT